MGKDVKVKAIGNSMVDTQSCEIFSTCLL